MRDADVSCHLVEQPNTPVCVTVTSRLASNASNRIASVPRGYHFRAIAVVHTAFVAQLAFLVENKHVRCCLRTIRARNRLRFPVVKIRVVEILIFDANFSSLPDCRSYPKSPARRFGSLSGRWAE